MTRVILIRGEGIEKEKSLKILREFDSVFGNRDIVLFVSENNKQILDLTLTHILIPLKVWGNSSLESPQGVIDLQNPQALQ